MDRYVTKNSLIFLGLISIFLTPALGFCDIWKLTRDAIARYKAPITYEGVVKYLPLLTLDADISTKTDSPDILIIGKGYFIMSREKLQSFRTTKDYLEGVEPEFEFTFEKPLSTTEKESKSKDVLGDTSEITSQKKLSSEGLKGTVIGIDILSSHPYFKTPIGSWGYEKFILELQDVLKKSLTSVGAEVIILRPKMPLSLESISLLNTKPPHIIITPQFNADKQQCMVTFCGGNISTKELVLETQRARWVHAALTRKSLYSVRLGACIAETCKKRLKVLPLDEKNASFEGTARPIALSEEVGSYPGLEENKKSSKGIALRNLIHNGFYSEAVVTPFPDMTWVQSQVQAGHEFEWIQQYVSALTEAILAYRAEQPATFE